MLIAYTLHSGGSKGGGGGTFPQEKFKGSTRGGSPSWPFIAIFINDLINSIGFILMGQV